VIEIEKMSEKPDFKKIQPLVAGVRGRKVFTEGNKEAGVWTAGQAMGLIEDIPSCEDLLNRIEKVIALATILFLLLHRKQRRLL
jgi:NADH:quinone reductase (non-electrogenic)